MLLGFKDPELDHREAREFLGKFYEYALKMGEAWRLEHPELMDAAAALEAKLND